MPKSTQQLEEQIRLARVIDWQRSLDGFTDEAIKPLQKAISQAQNEIMSRLEHWQAHPSPTGWSEDRARAILDELDSMTGGIQAYLTGHIADMAGHTGSASLDMFNNLVSWDGRVQNFNSVALTAAQVRSLAVETPVGGRLLEDWVARTFDQNMVSGIKNEIMTGMLKGEGYPALVDRISQGWDMTQADATSLARTYVQSANVGAMQSVYKQNQDIVKGERWCATLEIGGAKGGGTCLECAGLDGHEYIYPDHAPDCPLHCRCRCVLLPITKTWRKLGLDIDEMDQVYRPWTKSEDVINVGRGYHPPEMMGFHQGSFSDLFPKLSSGEQLAVVGPGRLGLIREGKIAFSDLVDPATGKLRLLEGKPGAWTGLKGFESGGEGIGGLGMGEGAGVISESPIINWKELTKESQFNEFGEGIFGNWKSGITKNEEEALKYYGSTGYRQMNYFLRNEDILRNERKEIIIEHNKYVERIDSALAKTNLTENVVAFRGLPLSSLGEEDINLLIGKEYHDLGFISTTINRTSAEKIASWIEKGEWGATEKGVLAEIRIPAGTKGGYLEGKLGSSSWNMKEYELLIVRGQKFKIVEAYIKKGKYHIVMELIS